MTAASRVSPPRLARELSQSNCRTYEHLAMAVLKRTLSQYASHSSSPTNSNKRRLDAKSWKLLKKRENLKIYKSREKFQPNVFAEANAGSSPQQQPMPARWAPHSRLLCVGTLPGTLEDAMLGTVTPTELSMATRSMAIKDEFIQHSVLQDIKVPTSDEPFEYVGLKWAMRSSALRSIVRARDLVYVEASGFQYVPLHGSHVKIGYTVCHSVEIPELQPATTTDVIRGKFSMCSIYRQTSPGVVDVFVTLMSDPGGSLPPKLAAQSAAGALVAAAKVMDCALERKLEALLKTKYTAAVSPDGACLAVAKALGSHWCCLRCTRNLTTFSSLSTCGVCHSTVCTRCLTSRKLITGATPLGITQSVFQVCTGCVATAQRGMDPAQVAADEFVPAIGRCKAGRKAQETQLELYDALTDTSSTVSRKNTRSPMAYHHHHADPVVLYDAPSDSPKLQASHRVPSYHSYIETKEFEMTKPLELDDLAMLDEQTTEDEDDQLIQTAQPLSPSEVQRLQLLEQMNELRCQAEQTFRLTKRTTRTLQRSKLDVDARFARRALSKSAIY